MLSINLTDGYKIDHRNQYPQNTELVYSNWTARKSRNSEIDHIVFFGLQYFIKKYLMEEFENNFFKLPKEKAIAKYKRRISAYLGADTIGYDHMEALHDLGYLPIEIKAAREGELVPIRTPSLTIQNTMPEFFWLTNYLETMMSCILWMPSTSATTAFEYRKILETAAMRTVGTIEAVDFQAHDFSFRGLPGIEAAMMSGAAHLLSFRGTDSIPAIDFLEDYYLADVEQELVGVSVPATEHSVMCMGQEHGEFDSFKRLISEVYPSGIVSIVSDSWDFWRVLMDYLPKLRTMILNREGKVVIRPDSGDPVKIICGDPSAKLGSPEFKGAVELLWEIFGGTVSIQGYKMLDDHIGLIYGDSITMERCKAICERLMAKGFATTNVVLGVGSFSYQYVTRDTFGFAMKATYGEIKGKGRAIYKHPKTDDGTKISAKGLIKVLRSEDRIIGYRDQATKLEEKTTGLELVYKDGKLIKNTTLAEIRERIKENLVHDRSTNNKDSKKSSRKKLG